MSFNGETPSTNLVSTFFCRADRILKLDVHKVGQLESMLRWVLGGGPIGRGKGRFEVGHCGGGWVGGRD